MSSSTNKPTVDLTESPDPKGNTKKKDSGKTPGRGGVQRFLKGLEDAKQENNEEKKAQEEKAALQQLKDDTEMLIRRGQHMKEEIKTSIQTLKKYEDLLKDGEKSFEHVKNETKELHAIANSTAADNHEQSLKALKFKQEEEMRPLLKQVEAMKLKHEEQLTTMITDNKKAENEWLLEQQEQLDAMDSSDEKKGLDELKELIKGKKDTVDEQVSELAKLASKVSENVSKLPDGATMDTSSLELDVDALGVEDSKPASVDDDAAALAAFLFSSESDFPVDWELVKSYSDKDMWDIFTGKVELNGRDCPREKVTAYWIWLANYKKNQDKKNCNAVLGMRLNYPMGIVRKTNTIVCEVHLAHQNPNIVEAVAALNNHEARSQFLIRYAGGLFGDSNNKLFDYRSNDQKVERVWTFLALGVCCFPTEGAFLEVYNKKSHQLPRGVSPPPPTKGTNKNKNKPKAAAGTRKSTRKSARLASADVDTDTDTDADAYA